MGNVKSITRETMATRSFEDVLNIQMPDIIGKIGTGAKTETETGTQSRAEVQYNPFIDNKPGVIPLLGGADLRSSGTGGGGGFLSGFLFNEVLPVKTARQALLQRQPQQKHLKKFINSMFK